MVVSISVMLHPFPHLMPWKRLLTYYIYNDPIIHAAIPNGSPLATLTLSDVPLRRNRVTSYSGQLFGHAGALTVSLNDAWEDDLNVTW